MLSCQAELRLKKSTLKEVKKNLFYILKNFFYIFSLSFLYHPWLLVAFGKKVGGTGMGTQLKRGMYEAESGRNKKKYKHNIPCNNILHSKKPKRRDSKIKGYQ